MDMSSTSLNNGAINNLLNMKSTVSLVKTTAQEMIKDAQKSGGGVIKKGDSQYKEEMDYNRDDEITISEKLRYYAEQTAQSLRDNGSNSQVKSLLQMTKSDYEKVGMSGYYDAQRNLQYSKALSAYSYQNLISKKINNFTISV
mgnify:FL=1